MGMGIFVISNLMTMTKTEKITSITFNRTSNIFINAGIVGLNYYLDEGEREKKFSISFKSKLYDEKLTIDCGDIPLLLEEVYYLMGKEMYDTSGKNARVKPDKFFFQKKPFVATPFFKMKTYGLGGLITNDPVPIAKEEANAITFKKLSKQDPDFAKDIANFYAQKKWGLKGFDVDENGFVENETNKKGDSKIFLNEPYIKITRFEPIRSSYIESGEEVCYLTNEKFKKLVDVQNTSPFIKGLNNFSSHLSSTSLKVSWKAMYLSRFSPKICLYSYVSGLDSIICFFFDSDNLKNLNKLFQKNSTFYKDQPQLIESNYMSNFKSFNFWQATKGGERFEESKDYTGRNEIQFILIYSLYQRLLLDKGVKSVNEIASFLDLGISKTPISLVSFRADKFSGTLRPSSFEYFNNFKFVLSLVIFLEKNKVSIKEIFQSLKFQKTSEKSSSNSYQLERKLREKIIGKMIKGYSILNEVELLYYQCFTYLVSGNSIGYKNFNQLSLLINLYEPIINKKMTKEIQEKAFNLGTSIGMAIIHSDHSADPKSNAKVGRKYIIDLQKSRTRDQFNDAIIRIQNRYQLTVSTELFKEMLNDDNFKLVKQYAIIGALNRINITIKPQKKKEDEK